MQSQKDSSPERRSCLRVKAEIRVYYGDSQRELLTGYSVDLSVGGVFLATKCLFDIDDNVKLKLSLAGQEEKEVSFDARVAWINYEDNRLKPEYPTGVGLQFIGLAQEDLSSIAGFLELEVTW